MTDETRTFSGERYEITVESNKDTDYIEISAVCRESNRSARITDMYFVLSELIEPIMEEKFARQTEGSDICIKNKTKHETLIAYIYQQLDDPACNTLSRLEEALNKDRRCDEWKNFATNCAICGRVPATHSFFDRLDYGAVGTLAACPCCYNHFTIQCVHCTNDIHIDCCEISEKCPACGEIIDSRH